ERSRRIARVCHRAGLLPDDLVSPGVGGGLSGLVGTPLLPASPVSETAVQYESGGAGVGTDADRAGSPRYAAAKFSRRVAAVSQPHLSAAGSAGGGSEEAGSRHRAGTGSGHGG